eukprot:PhF_6_TR5566/c1_g1_i1/m.7964
MYFVHTDSAEVVISITDNDTTTTKIGGGDSFTLKLVADTIRGKGHSVTGHCVVTSRESGRQHGVFELLRDRLTQDGEITSDDAPKSKITANNTAKTSSLSIKRIASDLTNTTTDNAADTPVSGMYAKPSNTPLYYNHQQYQNSINTDDQPNDPFSEEPDHHHHTHTHNNNLNHRMTNRLSYNSATTTNASVILDEAEDGDGEYTTGEMCAVVCEN